MVSPLLQGKELVSETPSLIIDSATVDGNLRRLSTYARTHSLKVRPHTKTHKSLEMSARQLSAGACGLTVAKVGEAEALAEASDDFLVAYPAFDPARSRRLAEFARSRTVRIAIDSKEGIEALAKAARVAGSTLGILVDVNVGFHRTGVGTPEASIELARLVAERAPSLRLDGIFFYPGHVWSTGDQQAKDLQQIDQILAGHLDTWQRHDLPATIVSGGSTPTQYASHLITNQTEIRPGTYLYNDMNTLRGGFCELSDCAAGIVCTIVSRAISGKAVLDGGTKTFTSDRNVTHPDSGHGFVLEYPEAKLVRLSEEHGELDLSACEKKPQLGERVTVIPNHICPCVNLQNSVQLIMADGSLKTLTIDARGRLV